MAFNSLSAYPAGLLELASRGLSSAYSRNIIVQYCSLTFELYAFPYHRQHKLVAHCSYFHYLELEERLGRGNFNRLNDQLNWIQNIELPDGQSHRWSCSAGLGVTKAYKLTCKGYEAIQDAMTNTRYPLVERKFKSSGNAIRSRDHSGSNSVGSFDMSPNLAIKTGVIKKAIKDINLLLSDSSARGTPITDYLRHFYADLPRHECITKLEQNRNALINILRVTLSPDVGKARHLLQNYVQSSSGRWYCRGPLVSLQNIPKQLRQIILQGNFDYDIESCHYSLFAQMASKLNFKTPVIDELIANKDFFRLEIASTSGITINQVKQSLISLIYGSPLNTSVFCSLGNNLGHEAAKVFCELEVVRALHNEIKQGARLIIESYKNQSRRRGTIINDLGRSCVISKSSRPTQLSHILQGAEAQILSSVGQRWGSSLLLLMHDGFVSKNQLSTSMMSQHVFKETGWDIQFSEEFITISKCTKI